MITMFFAYNRPFFLPLLVFTALMFTGISSTKAQLKAVKDTSEPGKVTIYSEFKPQLKSYAKINFSTSGLLPDSSKGMISYDVPEQYLNFGFQPAPFQPAYIQHDTLYETGYRKSIRVGYGNYATPFIQAAASIGDPTRLLANFYGNYRSSKGKIENQDFSMLHAGANMHYELPRHELSAAIRYESNQYYLYGYNHDLLQYTKQQINQHFQSLDFNVGFKNVDTNSVGINYHPQLGINFFSKKDSASERTILLELPFSKPINEKMSVAVSLGADITQYKTSNRFQGDTSFKNNILAIKPSLQYKHERFKGDFGISGYLNENKWILLPVARIEFPVVGHQFKLEAGWVGNVIKNTYRNLTAINPYLSNLARQNNTTETEIYGGINMNVGKRFFAKAKAGVVSYKNFNLFISDTSTGLQKTNGFLVSNEASMSNFRIKGELNYIVPAVITANASVIINGYTGLDKNEKAWNTLPLEFNSSIRWNAFHFITLTAEMRAFAGGKYLAADKSTGSIPSAFDLSIGAEKKIKKQLGLFLNVNNIFGKTYERWNNYPVYGLNVLGGLSYRF